MTTVVVEMNNTIIVENASRQGTVFISPNTFVGGSVDATWGDITGTIHLQSDLMTLFAGKADDSDPRLSDARVPLAHSHTIGDVSGLTLALADKLPIAEKGAANGVATLDSAGKIPESQIPAVAITDTFAVANQAEMLALTAQRGDVAVRSDLNETFILAVEPASSLANWILLRTPTNAVLSVAGKTGAVGLNSADVGLGNVNNTSDLDKPISTDTANALAGKLGDAPSDGQQYVRKNSAWSVLVGGGGGSGDMQASVYDPQNISGDAFDRANHTGTQLMASITDKQGKVLDDPVIVSDGDTDSLMTPGGYLLDSNPANGPLAGTTVLVSAADGYTLQQLLSPIFGVIQMRYHDGAAWQPPVTSVTDFTVQGWYNSTTAEAPNAVVKSDGSFARSLFVPASLAPKITVGLTANADTDILRPDPLTTATTFPNPIGFPMDGFGFVIELIDDGTARALTWGSDYAAGFAALPTTTTAGKLGQIAIQYRGGKYRCDGVRWMA